MNESKHDGHSWRRWWCGGNSSEFPSDFPVCGPRPPWARVFLNATNGVFPQVPRRRSSTERSNGPERQR